jgi:hypothetical protein
VKHFLVVCDVKSALYIVRKQDSKVVRDNPEVASEARKTLQQ